MAGGSARESKKKLLCDCDVSIGKNARPLTWLDRLQRTDSKYKDYIHTRVNSFNMYWMPLENGMQFSYIISVGLPNTGNFNFFAKNEK